MIKGEKIRFDIHKILYSIYKYNKTLNNVDIKKIINKHKKEDIAFLNNVSLNTMRFYFLSIKIIERYVTKSIKDKEKVLLLSAITQIVFLNFKEYAVINCSVEIAKKLNIYHGFINAILKEISKNKESLRNIKVDFNDFPDWFKNKAVSLSDSEKKKFLENYNKKPSLHIVFKNKEKLNSFEEGIIKTSEISGFLIKNRDITEIESFKNGDWWVQDFSSFFPLHNLQIMKNHKKFLDACAAPGGKSFQLLSKKLKLTLNDKSSSRIKILKSNLNRLNYNTKVLNEDFTTFKENEKYDFVIVDAPCSSIGTIRKNPEIFFKNKGPDFLALNTLQKKMLNKAAKLLNVNGLILYMVCSFLKNETKDQVNNFIMERKDFEIHDFDLITQDSEYLKLLNNNFMITLPETIKKNNIDGYFAVYLKKIK